MSWWNVHQLVEKLKEKEATWPQVKETTKILQNEGIERALDSLDEQHEDNPGSSDESNGSCG